MNRQTRLVEVRQHVLKQNDVAARALRARFREAGVYVVSLVSSPGAGKTAFLERTLTDLGRDHRVAALVGDLATDNDARRLARSGAPVRQITTGTVCHLEADMVARTLDGWRLEELDFLFVENVGNLVCPATFDLGEALRVVLLSVTEGEDKPLKYPLMFRSCELVVVNKLDLLDHDELLALQERIGGLAPSSVFVSTVTEDGLEPLKRALVGAVRARRPVTKIWMSPGDGKLLAEIHREGEVLDQRMDGERLLIEARVDEALAGRLRRAGAKVANGKAPH